MKVSQKGIDLIKSFEGLVLHPYLDSVGVPTIGYGSTMYKSGDKVKMSDSPISLKTAEELLAWEIGLKTLGVNNALGNHIVNQNQYDAIISFSYNVGIGGFAGSTLLKKIKVSPCDPTIRDEFMKWNKGTIKGKKVVIDGLTKRRKKEADLYFSNIA